MTRREICFVLENARKERGLTYKALGARIGMTPDNVRGILQGWQEPRLGSLLLVCRGLGLEVAVVAKESAVIYATEFAQKRN